MVPDPKPDSKKSAQPQAPQAKQLTITIPSVTINIDKPFKAKLPFLLLLLLLFSFSLVMFEKANFRTIDLLDFQRFEYQLQKAYSLSFFLFVLLFSASLGIAIFFGAHISRVLSLVALPVVFIPAIALGLVYPGLLSPFLAFALTVGAGSVIASFYREPSFSNVWGTASKALLVLLVLSFFIVFGKVAAAKDAHVDAFFNGAASLLPSGPGITASMLKTQMLHMPSFKPFYDNFALLAAITAVAIVSIMNFFVQILASAAAFGLSKL